MLKQRLTVGIIGGIVAIVILCLNVKIVSVVLAILAIIGLSEIYNATGMLKKQNKLCILSYIYSFIAYILLSFVASPGLALAVLTALYGFVLLMYMIFNHESCGFSDVSELFFQTAYVSILFAHIILVRRLEHGNYIIWFIFITAWLSDTVAFAVGKRFGRNKLIPQISPKKTVEGAVGGLAGSVIFNLIYGLVCSGAFELDVNFGALVLVAFFAGIVSQLGDLTASCIKREHNIKDFSNLLPGHGGILDRFDSVLFVAPTIYYMVSVLGVIS